MLVAAVSAWPAGAQSPAADPSPGLVAVPRDATERPMLAPAGWLLTAAVLTALVLLTYVAGVIAREQQRARDEAIRLSAVDPLTGLFNSDYARNFKAFLEQKTPGQPFAFVYGAKEPHGPYEKGSGLRAGYSTENLQLTPNFQDTSEQKYGFNVIRLLT